MSRPPDKHAGDVPQAPADATAEALIAEEYSLKIALSAAQGKTSAAALMRASGAGGTAPPVAATTEAAASLSEQLTRFVTALDKRCQHFSWQAEALEKPAAPAQHSEPKLRTSLQRASGLVTEVLAHINTEQEKNSEDNEASKAPDPLAHTKQRAAAIACWLELSVLAVVTNELSQEAKRLCDMPEPEQARLIQRIIDLEAQQVALENARVLACYASAEVAHVLAYLASAKKAAEKSLRCLKKKIGQPLQSSLQAGVAAAEEQVKAAKAARECAIRDLHREQATIDQEIKRVEAQVAAAKARVTKAKAECNRLAASLETKERGLAGAKGLLAQDLEENAARLTEEEKALAAGLSQGEAQLVMLLKAAVAHGSPRKSGEVNFKQKYGETLAVKREEEKRLVEAQKEKEAAITHLQEVERSAEQQINAIKAAASARLAPKLAGIDQASAQHEAALANKEAVNAHTTLLMQSLDFRVAREALNSLIASFATDAALAAQISHRRNSVRAQMRDAADKTSCKIEKVDGNVSTAHQPLAAEGGDAGESAKRFWKVLNKLSLLVRYTQAFVNLGFQPCQMGSVVARRTQTDAQTPEQKDIQAIRETFLQAGDWYARITQQLQFFKGLGEEGFKILASLQQQHLVYQALKAHFQSIWALAGKLEADLSSQGASVEASKLKLLALEIQEKRSEVQQFLKAHRFVDEKGSFFHGELIALHKKLDTLFARFPEVSIFVSKATQVPIYSNDIERILRFNQYDLPGYSGEDTVDAMRPLKNIVLGARFAMVVFKRQPSDVSAKIEERRSRLTGNVKQAFAVFPELKAFDARIWKETKAADAAVQAINAFLPKNKSEPKPGEAEALQAAKDCLARLQAAAPEDMPFLASDMQRLLDAIAQVSYYKQTQAVELAIQSLRDATPENRAARIAAAKKCLGRFASMPEAARPFLQTYIYRLQDAIAQAKVALSREASDDE